MIKDCHRSLQHSSLHALLDFLTIESPPSWMNSLEVIRQLLLTHPKQKLLTSTVRIWVDHHGTVKWYLALLSYLQSWFFLVTPLRIFNYGSKRLIWQTVQTLLSYSQVRFSPHSSSMIRHLLSHDYPQSCNCCIWSVSPTHYHGI
jgi:hypothetical protein